MAEDETRKRRKKLAKAALQHIHDNTDLDYQEPLVQRTILALARDGWLRKPQGSGPVVVGESMELVDVTGTRRRLEALTFEGWSVSATASYLQLADGSLLAIVRGKRRRCTTRVAQEVTSFFEDTPEPLEARPGDLARVLAAARRRGYVPRHRWAGLDIDDPGVHPHPSVV